MLVELANQCVNMSKLLKEMFILQSDSGDEQENTGTEKESQHFIAHVPVPSQQEVKIYF